MNSELQELRDKLAAYERDVPILAAKLKRAERLADVRLKMLKDMEADIANGAVVIDCPTCKGAGEFTEMERGNPYTARELKCSDCGATGQVEYKCVKIDA